jgi:D-alanine-D-alanine ligase
MAVIRKSQIANRKSQNRFGKIGVLMGGPSSEREISLKSGKAVYEALKQSGLEVIAIDIKTDSIEENIRLIESCKIDCAFLALHGRFGEDGQIQEILEIIKIPYTGSGVLASRLAMDKVASRKIFQSNGLNVPKYKVVEKKSFAEISACRRSAPEPDYIRHKSNWKVNNDLELPLVIKPATHGSSIGLSIIDKQEDLDKAVNLAFTFDERIIIEEYVEGREVTVGILKEQPLPVIEIIPKKRFFDYEAKYTPGMTDYEVPAKLEESVAREVKKAALSAHKLLGCSGCSRVDMILSKDNLPFVLEVNTIPGLTNTSLLPRAAKTQGIEFNELCLKLIKLAYEKTKV